MKLRLVVGALLFLSPVIACNVDVEDDEETEVASEAVRGGKVGRCGSRERSDADEGAARTAMSAAAERSGDVDVHVHVVHTTRGVGNVDDGVIAAQIAALDRGYAGTGFGFRLKSVDRTANDAWASSTSKHERAMKKALHRGKMSDLNVYVTPGLGDLVGWAYFPDDLPKDDPRMDGVVIASTSLPGGAAPYGLGFTAVHEVGHWLGLEHTFKGGCDGKNDDFVDDTPREKGMHFGCEVGRDSCKKDKGKDPVHNFMSYSDDACLTEFTHGQTRRMKKMWSAYRAR